MNAVIQTTHRGRPVALGKRPAPPLLGAHRLRALKLAAVLPPAPATRDWLAACSPNFGAMLNDSLGDCTIAAAGHAQQVWTANNGPEVTPPDAAILAGYEQADGYNPADPSSDQGGVETQVLAFWQGVGIAGVKIDGWSPVSPAHLDHLRQVINTFGCAYVGVALPLTAQDQDDWTVALGGGADAEPGSWGGHAIVLGAYDADSFYCVTWGERKRISNDWILAYCDEAYAPLCKSLWAPTGTSPGGDQAGALDAYLAAVS